MNTNSIALSKFEIHGIENNMLDILLYSQNKKCIEKWGLIVNMLIFAHFRLN